ncbi:hypothetical protein LCGC14_0559960 [marine sediment metagenome]|uniref:Uncharacterized protein n=1 Tax=marine sediment metagenome TaxID=412755 RepID=A0A0F9RSB7_9ZZZZ
MSEEKYYFVSYVKNIQETPHFCNDTIKEHPVQWIMEKCKKAQMNFYNLVFYKEITLEEYVIFHPEEIRLPIPKEDLGTFTDYSKIG